jgi:hypothetical protein
METGATITGTIEKIMPVQEINDKFKKRDIVINTGGDYPQQILVQFTNDQCALFNSILEGEHVVIDANLRGREWTNPETGQIRYFNTIQGWRIQTVDGNAKPQPQPNSTEQSVLEDATKNETDDDLPF